jgi:hypothetical protein
MHLFTFDVEQPQLIYTAEDRGTGRICRIDLRTNIVDKLFDTRSLSYRKTPEGYRSKPLTSVKALAQSPLMAHSLLVGGKGLSIGLLDLRCLSGHSCRDGNDDDHDSDESDNTVDDQKWPFAHMYGPHYPHSQTGRCAISPECLSNADVFDTSEVGISGLQLSRDGHTILASYQGDQIYTFELLGSYSHATTRCTPVVEPSRTEYSTKSSASATSSEGGKRGTGKDGQPVVNHAYCLDPDNDCPQDGAVAMYGGHVNHATFLKSVSFWGPRDEYIVAGSDSGHVWVWDATSGRLDGVAPEDRSCRVVNFLKADNHTCNGVVPHPLAPVLASYGIDNDVKLWASVWGDEEEEEEEEEPQCKSRDRGVGGVGGVGTGSGLTAQPTDPGPYALSGLGGADRSTKKRPRAHLGSSRSEHCDLSCLPSYLKDVRDRLRDALAARVKKTRLPGSRTLPSWARPRTNARVLDPGGWV